MKRVHMLTMFILAILQLGAFCLEFTSVLETKTTGRHFLKDRPCLNNCFLVHPLIWIYFIILVLYNAERENLQSEGLLSETK